MYTFKMYFTGDQEQFEYDPWGGAGDLRHTKNAPLSGEPAELFGAGLHRRRAQRTLAPEMTKELLRLSEQLAVYQRQAQVFLERVLDIDQVGREAQQNTRRQYRFDQPCDPELFRFEAIPVSFGPVGGDTCGPILQPSTIRDLIDFSLRECVTRGVPVRRCRSCGRYFPLTGRVTAEYCGRPNPNTKPCRNTGAAHSIPVHHELLQKLGRLFCYLTGGETHVPPEAVRNLLRLIQSLFKAVAGMVKVQG